jgi:hypothetical protein
MTNLNLGKLEPVALREAWPDEAADFTPWLHDNIEMLGEALGLQLEVEERERAVGSFSADLLCREVDSDAWVVVENQLESTNHRHLGQIITYAAGLNASFVIWVAQNFREEHRAAIDWLNDVTGEAMHFFGIEVQLLRIGDSPTAPRFEIICKPNEFSKAVKRIAETGELSELRQTQLGYWTEFGKLLAASGVVSPAKPEAVHSRSYPCGRSGMRFGTTAATFDPRGEFPGGFVRVQFSLSGSKASIRFKKLLQDRAQIESEVGQALTWFEEEGTQKRRIYIAQEADPLDESDWASQHEWLRSNLENLWRVLKPRIQAL